MDITEKLEEQIAQHEQGAVIPIYKPDGTPYTSSIDGSQSNVTVLGSQSKKVRAAQDAASKRLINQRRGKWEPADGRKNRLETAVAAIIDWHGWEVGEEPAPCTPENVRLLLRDEDILSQVEEGVARHADFFDKSQTS